LERSYVLLEQRNNNFTFYTKITRWICSSARSLHYFDLLYRYFLISGTDIQGVAGRQ
jgi:hypothetical protein